jgi:hypothetical protein
MCTGRCRQPKGVAGHGGGISYATLGLLVFEKAFQIRAALDDGARPLLQLAVDPLEEWRADLHMRALFQRDFVCKVAQLGMSVRDLLDLLPQERVLLSQFVVPHGRFLTTLLRLLRRRSPRAVGRSAGLTPGPFRGWPGNGARLEDNRALLTLFRRSCRAAPLCRHCRLGCCRPRRRLAALAQMEHWMRHAMRVMWRRAEPAQRDQKIQPRKEQTMRQMLTAAACLAAALPLAWIAANTVTSPARGKEPRFPQLTLDSTTSSARSAKRS